MTLGVAMKHLKGIEQELWSKRGSTRTLARQPLVPVYRVGELFHRGRRLWPEGGQFAFSPGGLELTLFRSDISANDVREVRQGEFELALIAELPLIVLAYRFGATIPWDDVPYSWHLQPASWRVVPSVEHSPEARALLWITLVNTADGIIQAQRGVTLSPSFTHALSRAIRAQAIMPFDPDECTTAISTVFLSYPTTVDRLVLAKARTMGNE
jgi:hypothetical protein